MRYLLPASVAGLFLLFVGCSTATFRTVKLKVEAEPAPSFVEVEGMVACEKTPCQIELPCRNEAGGTTEIAAVPSGDASKGLFRQARRVYACGIQPGQTGSLRFNLRTPPTPEAQHAPVQPEPERSVGTIQLQPQKSFGDFYNAGKCSGLAPFAPVGCHMACIGGSWQSVCP